MNVSWRWLSEMVPGMDLTPEALGEHLALRGAPVEEITSPGDGLGDIVIGRVVTAQQHPNADRLRLCTVDGGDGIVSVVCGAPNVKEGAYYPFAPVGAVLPGDFKIKKSKIRGEVSQGMLCSARELGLGVDHDGILELSGEYEPGTRFVESVGLDDATLDVEITANRGDLLSHIGVARELASEGEGVVRLATVPGASEVELEYLRAAPEVEAAGVSVRVDDLERCPRYLGVVIRGVKIGPSPEWLQTRLRGAGARPISNVVDVTNYVMLELGQPLHAFDLAKLGGAGIVVRRAAASEASFTTLDEEERAVTPDMLMICDREQPVAIAGVMGGRDSEVSDDTVDLLLECAHFEPKSTRATRRELVMSTDASYRYEQGVDPSGMERAVARAVSLILATAGGQVDGPVLDCCEDDFVPDVVPLRLDRIERVLGVPFTAETTTTLLTPLGFEVVSSSEEVLEVRVPGFRSFDVKREIDLIEEVARTYGYDRFPAELGAHRPGTVPDDPLFQLEDELRRALAGQGMYEAQTPAFVAEGEGDVQVSNPLTTTEPFVRRALLPSLLRRLEYNLAHGNRDVRLFEIGTSFRKAASGEPPIERTHIALVATGRRRPPHFARQDEELDLWDLKAVFEDVLRRAYPGGVSLSGPEGSVPSLDPTACFEATSGEIGPVGHGGRIAVESLDVPVWAGSVFGFEITLPANPAGAEPVTAAPMPQYPAAERDLAVVVDAGVTAGAVADVVRRTAGPLLESVELFDVYEGEKIADDKRSLAYRLRFRSPERTLKDKQVDKAIRGVLGKLEEELGAEHRDG